MRSEISPQSTHFQHWPSISTDRSRAFTFPPPEVAIENGYPPLPDGGLPCEAYGDDLPKCSRAQFLQGLIDHPPVNHPFYTPSYSNVAYAILGLAYEAIAGVPIDKAQDTLYNDKLGMTDTTAHAPPSSVDAVIPYNDSYALFTYDIGIQGP
jgi:CubicO group peptidase (beta-lactamase class C family)